MLVAAVLVLQLKELLLVLLVWAEAELVELPIPQVQPE
jgi:hypothetical protein